MFIILVLVVIVIVSTMADSAKAGVVNQCSVAANINSVSIRQEIQRFESVHPCIYAVYDLLELLQDPLLAQNLRDHVVSIEGINQTIALSTLHVFQTCKQSPCFVTYLSISFINLDISSFLHQIV